MASGTGGHGDIIRVLHVDDEPDFADMTATFLERENEQFEIETAASASDGLDHLADTAFDCVISDYDMPGRNGIEFLEAVREEYPDLPFILYTGKGSEEVASDAISAGVTDYLQKGSGTDQYTVLANRISNAVSAHRATAEVKQTRQRLEQILKTVPACVVQLNYDGEFIFANERAVEVLGLERSDVTERTYNDPEWKIRDLDGNPIPDEELPFRQVRDSEESLYGYRHTIVWPDGTRKVLLVNGVPLFDDDGTVQSVIFALSDITDEWERQTRLQQATARLQALFERSPDMINVHDSDGTIVDVNPRLREETGYDEDELVGMKVWELDAAIDTEEARALWAEMGMDERRELEGIYRRRDGSTFPAKVHVRRIELEGKDRFVVISRNITERKERERELERATERIEFALNQVNAGVWELDPETETVTSYPTHCPVFDADIETVSDFVKRVHPDDRARAESAIQTAAETGDTLSVEYQTSPDIEAEWTALQINPIEDKGEVSRVAGLARDISDRKARQRKLTQLQKRMQALMHTRTRKETARVATDAADDIIDAPLSGVHLLTDREEMLEPAAVIDRVFDAFDEVPSYHREAPAGSRAALVWSVFERGEPLRIDDTHEYDQLTEPTPARSVIIHPMEGHGVFVISSDEPHAFTETDEVLVEILATTLTTALDRVEQERARRDRERELEETNAVLSTLFETLPVGVIAEDVGRNVLAVNQRLLELFEMSGTPDEVIGADCEQVADQVSEMFVDAEDFAERINELVAERKPIRNEDLSLADGRTYERSYRPIELPDGDGHLWMYRDVTDQKKREARLEALNETARELMAASTQAEVAEIGVTAARDILDLKLNGIHLYDDEQAGLVPVAQTEESKNLVGKAPTFTERDSIAWRVYESGEPLALDDVQDDPDVYNAVTPVRSELYLPIGGYGILLNASETPEAFDREDIVLGELLAGTIATALEQIERTEQLRTRERDLERQNERLEEFASVVSHDLRNPLQTAEGNLELLKEECDSERIEAIAHSLTRMEDLIEDLLTLAREGKTVSEMKVVDLGEISETCWQTVETERARLVTDIDRPIQADRSRIQQLLENLIRNAVEHGGEDVTVTVRELDDGFCVEDDGPGIPESDRDMVFDASYSTTEEGTGFGLSIVKQVADAHGWNIRLTEGSDGGARFEITGVEFAV